ncbi:MAG: glycosyltransferase [Leptospirales bacterium]|nr:glycosyltransferase [Leptospirales bacterium]
MTSLAIVTITRNDHEGLKQTLASAGVLREQFGVKHIVVDGSDPGIVEQNRNVAHGSGITYVVQTGRGISEAFNQGIALVDTEWIWCVNGGDSVHSKLDAAFLMKCLEHSVAEGIIFDVDCGTHRSSRPPVQLMWPPLENWIVHSGTFLRTSVLRRFNGFKSNYKAAMDAELWMRMLHAGVKFDMISYVVSYFAPGGYSSIGSNSAGEILRLAREFRWRIFKRWIGQMVYIISSWNKFRKQKKRR